MLRVLLVLEDYGELVFLQILLSKLGFDVGTLKNPKAMQDSLAKLNPDVVLMTARGKRVNGTELSAHIKKIQGRPKIVFLLRHRFETTLEGGNSICRSRA